MVAVFPGLSLKDRTGCEVLSALPTRRFHSISNILLLALLVTWITTRCRVTAKEVRSAYSTICIEYYFQRRRRSSFTFDDKETGGFESIDAFLTGSSAKFWFPTFRVIVQRLTLEFARFFSFFSLSLSLRLTHLELVVL